MVSVTVLMENSPAVNKSLKYEHGLSLFIKTPKNKILFDFGSSDIFLYNAQRMDIDLNDLDVVVCSHGHYDHSGGFADFVSKYKIKKFITGEGFFEPKYRADDSKFAYIGNPFNKQLLLDNNIEHIECKDVYKIDDNCYVFSGFKRTTPYEEASSNFVCGNLNEDMKVDNFNDEICLVIKTDNELCLLTACSHPGIVNMVKSVGEYFNSNVTSIYGGIHLVEADGERIKNTIADMKKLGLKKAGFCHCSGNKVKEVVKNDDAIESSDFCTGDSIIIR
ncbi:MBL fold metallo-hydrolase [uncultured Brachyspira sp.]|uniref:MBL fold metallo-hydrolase n=1 Tax=uncultured Brachyspira sp. TaxID=221953 RepID=UPI0026153841|nr:MBL fold metallo-hydrolase [uncultured Brachyspira sp.]